MELKCKNHEAIVAITGEKFTVIVNKDSAVHREEISRFKAEHNVLHIHYTARRNEQGEPELAAVITYEADSDETLESY